MTLGAATPAPAAAAAAPIVQAEQLSKWYGQVIGLNDVSVSVPPGITGLLGPNGAGKSTFMKLVTGQLKPSKGAIRVFGEPIWGNPALYFRIGFCPEQDAFYERSTITAVRPLTSTRGRPPRYRSARRWTSPRSHAEIPVELVAAHPRPAEAAVVVDADRAVLTDCAHAELRLDGHAELADDDDVEQRIEAARDLGPRQARRPAEGRARRDPLHAGARAALRVARRRLGSSGTDASET